MMELEMPKISVEENDDRSYVKIVVEHLEKGFGITIGNCLRRTLMSELPGAAIQGIKFDSALDVKHELSTIKNVVEEKHTMIIVTHEMNFAREVSDKIVFMDGGYVIEEGKPEDLFTNPKEERTAQFLQRYR